MQQWRDVDKLQGEFVYKGRKNWTCTGYINTSPHLRTLSILIFFRPMFKKLALFERENGQVPVKCH